MPQNAIPTDVAVNPLGQAAPLRVDSSGSQMVNITVNSAATYTQVGGITAGSIFKNAAGLVSAISNTAIISSTQIAALTTASIGALYDTQIASLTTTQLNAISVTGVAALTSTQIATLTTTNIAALVPQALGTAFFPALTLPPLQMDYGIVYVPGSGQQNTVQYK